MPATAELDPRAAFHAMEPAEVVRRLGSAEKGLTREQTAARPIAVVAPRWREGSTLRLLLRQLASPLVLILVAAALTSAALGDRTDAAVILVIVLASGALGFQQERGAANTMRALLALVRVRARVLRDGRPVALTEDEIVPGDVLLLDAGTIVPADARVLSARDCFADEAPLTGETFPVEKRADAVPADTPLARRSSAVFAGTHVVSGTATAIAVRTGRDTELGRLTSRVTARVPPTEFEHSLRRFGAMLLELTLVLVLVIFAVNVILAKPALDAFMFSVAVAVGLTPQLLPAIVSVNLARGARRLATAKVIVKRLSSIENFGSMDVLCSDKTGTLTEGRVELHGAFEPSGRPSDDVFELAWLNAALESGYRNPVDEAIRGSRPGAPEGVEKLDEVPYDFVRKRLSIALRDRSGRARLVTKGALANVLGACTFVRQDGRIAPIEEHRAGIDAWFARTSAEGRRVLGVGARELDEGELPLGAGSEAGMVFEGFVVLEDPPKPGIASIVKELAELGVSLKMITGDNAQVARAVAARVGLSPERVVSGRELAATSDAALVARAASAQVFAEVEPNQKERILLALRKGGHVVGFLGDGINDAPALHLADVSIAVDSGADAKRAADFVLLEHDLGVLVEGVREGRRTFANTLKYVRLATSANFGNMVSMAAASLFLPFLPLLPSQVLLVNLLTDLPEMTIAGDRVDPEMVAGPERLDLHRVRRFMLVFGLVSSAFDLLTFALLFWVVQPSVAAFRTGWFVESVVSAALIVLVLRTSRPLHRSRPSKTMATAVIGVVLLVVALPYTPLASPLGLVPLDAWVLLLLGAIVAGYVAATSVAKAVVERHSRRDPPPGSGRAAGARPRRERTTGGRVLRHIGNVYGPVEGP